MGHTCRGTINLATANITVEDSCNFIISNGGAQTYHLKASSEVERQRWITALELAKAKAVKMQAESDDSADEEQSSQTDKTEVQNTLRTLTSKVEDLSTCNDLIAKHGTALQRSLSELENLKLPPESSEKIKQVNERATLFRITSNAMINLSMTEPFLPCCCPPRLVTTFLFAGSTGSRDLSDEDDENEFFDAMEDVAEFITVQADSRYHRRTGSNISGASSEGTFEDQGGAKAHQLTWVLPFAAGTIHCNFHQSGNHYTWKKVTTTVHNIIVGKLWIDQSGEVDIINRKTRDKCHLKFAPYSYFSRDVARKVTGVVSDSMGKAHFILSGTWDEKMEYSRVLHSSKGENSAEGRQKTVYETLRGKELWRRHKALERAESMYYFSELALSLNELEDGVAPTDSRLRPDQRLMENGRWDEANMEKQRLEEKQRAVRRKRESDVSKLTDGQTHSAESSYRPLWFERREDPYTKELVHVYKGGYWEAKEKQDWHLCPDIF
ncbi:hypothetical protein chiPu_0013746 [Chiloscyllium punctatum]|uniref:PH domain-containing protein n=1 Tax=Chiloscyllium punctatum TaxID=137246 RepID=A0A401SY01_CHIPU|nr:hypothetical protein [Chiloscyllium punctatum]